MHETRLGFFSCRDTSLLLLFFFLDQFHKLWFQALPHSSLSFIQFVCSLRIILLFGFIIFQWQLYTWSKFNWLANLDWFFLNQFQVYLNRYSFKAIFYYFLKIYWQTLIKNDSIGSTQLIDFYILWILLPILYSNQHWNFAF